MLLVMIMSGCKVKEYTPELPLSFTNTATVNSGDFSFECEICKSEKDVKVTVLSTKAKGLIMCCDGDNLTFTYDKLSHSVDSKEFEQTNAAIIVYDVFDCLYSNAQSKKIDGGYQHYGKTSLGDFVLVQNDDNTLKSIEFKSEGIFISFT